MSRPRKKEASRPTVTSPDPEKMLYGYRPGDVVETDVITRRLLEAMPYDVPVTFRLPEHRSALSARSNAYASELLLEVDFSCRVSRRRPNYITITKLPLGTKEARKYAAET